MIRVLVVDDDYRVADLHAQYVARVSGFEVAGTARTAREAVEHAAELRPDLVLLDQYLPDALGTSVLRELTGDVIMLTAAAGTQEVRTALGAGVVGYLIKPFEERDLAGRLLAYARYRGRLRGDRRVSQDEIDSALAVLHGAKPRRVRSTSPTSELVAESMRSCEGPVTATELAGKLGISRPTAQRYLAELAADGRLRVELRYGAAGRPEHLYYWRHS